MAVVSLHDVVTGMSRPNGLPADTFPMEAARLRESLTSLARRVGHPSDASATALRTALEAYAAVAGRLSAPDAKPWRLVPELRATDVSWRAALTALGTRSHVDLLAGLPPLLVPSTAPAPPTAP
jgi:hypothetical protein